MPRRTFYVDLPVTKKTRTRIKRKKGEKSYDKFLNDILDTELGF